MELASPGVGYRGAVPGDGSDLAGHDAAQPVLGKVGPVGLGRAAPEVPGRGFVNQENIVLGKPSPTVIFKP